MKKEDEERCEEEGGAFETSRERCVLKSKLNATVNERVKGRRSERICGGYVEYRTERGIGGINPRCESKRRSWRSSMSKRRHGTPKSKRDGG